MNARLIALAETVRRDLRQFHVTELERLLVEALLDLSFGAGRPWARVQRLDDFGPITGMARPKIHALLARLRSARVISVTGSEYRVLPLSQDHRWELRRRVDPLAYAAAMESLRASNGITQGELLAPEPDLVGALAIAATEAALHTHTHTPQTEPSAFAKMRQAAGSVPFSATKLVPYLGTAVPESVTESVSEKGTRKQSLHCNPTVCEDGTAPAPDHGHGTWSTCHGHGIAVPEKGTGREGAEAMELVDRYLPKLKPEHRNQWQRRSVEEPELVRFAVEEAASRRERVANMAGYANSVYLKHLKHLKTGERR
jgi:hypothetical protein